MKIKSFLITAASVSIIPVVFIIFMPELQADVFCGSNNTECSTGSGTSTANCPKCCLCLYQEASVCAGLTAATCASTTNPDTKTYDCYYDASNGGCISRFKEACITSLSTAGCDVYSDSIQPDPSLSYQETDVSKKGQVITNFKSAHSCDKGTFNYFESEHGTQFDCPELGKTIQACLSCSGSGCSSVNVVANGCSKFQDQNAVTTMAKNLQLLLIDNGSTSTTITITANQAVATLTSCQTPETITITASSMYFSYPDCSTMASQSCIQSYDVAYCNNNSETDEYLCCGVTSDTSGTWEKINDPSDVCKGDTVTYGFAEGKDCDDSTAWSIYAKAANKVQDDCKAKNQIWYTLPLDTISHQKDADGQYHYSMYWQCITKQ